MEYKSCAVTGHRPTRFKWKYNENNNGCKRLKRRLKEQLIQLYEKGVRRFYTGGALGTDLWSGELLIELKEQPEYSEINLILVLPFDGHEGDKTSPIQGCSEMLKWECISGRSKFRAE